MRPLENILSWRVFYFVITFLTLGVFYPFVHTYVFFPGIKLPITIGFLSLWISLLIIEKNWSLRLPQKSFNIIVFIQSVFFLAWSVILGSDSIRAQGINLLISWMFVVLIINSFSRSYFLVNYIRINLISLCLCIVGLLVLAFGLAGVLSVHEYNSDRKIFNYGFFFVKRLEEVDLNLRPSGYYDEPGSFAFLIMLLLLLNRKFYKNKKYEISMLLLTFVTGSFAHLITSIVFVGVFYLAKGGLAKRLLLIISTSLLFILLTKLLLYIDYGVYYLSKTLDRLQSVIHLTQDGGRGGGFDLGPTIFNDYPFGISPEKVKILYPGFVNETIWAPLVFYGLAGVPFYFLIFIPILRLAWTINSYTLWCALMMLGLNLIQRPNFMYPIAMVLIYYLFFVENRKWAEKEK